MFDLEQAIMEWRRQTLAAGIKSPTLLEELENHLREEIGRQIKSGLVEQSAFNFAVQEIGPAPTLQIEFMKIETKEIRRWKLFEAFFLVCTLLIPLTAGIQAFVFKEGSFSEMTAGQQMASLSGAVTFALFACAIRFSHERFPGLRTNKIRDVIFVPVLLWVMACIIILPRCGLSDGQRSVVSLWAFAPFGILIGWLWGFAIASRKKLAAASV